MMYLKTKQNMKEAIGYNKSYIDRRCRGLLYALITGKGNKHIQSKF